MLVAVDGGGRGDMTKDACGERGTHNRQCCVDAVAAADVAGTKGTGTAKADDDIEKEDWNIKDQGERKKGREGREKEGRKKRGYSGVCHARYTVNTPVCLVWGWCLGASACRYLAASSASGH